MARKRRGAPVPVPVSAPKAKAKTALDIFTDKTDALLQRLRQGLFISVILTGLVLTSFPSVRGQEQQDEYRARPRILSSLAAAAASAQDANHQQISDFYPQLQHNYRWVKEKGAVINNSIPSIVVRTVTSKSTEFGTGSGSGSSSTSSESSSSPVKPTTGSNSNKWTSKTDKEKSQVKSKSKTLKLPILYDSSGIDREFQQELLTAVQVALRDLVRAGDSPDLEAQYLDVGKISISGLSSPSTITSSLITTAQWIQNNRTLTAVSLLDPEILSEFVQIYDQYQTKKGTSISTSNFKPNSSKKILKIISPRLLRKNVLAKNSVEIFSMQMSESAMATALLNRVEKIRVATLIPILDKDDSAQLELLGYFIAAGQHRTEPISFTSPIFVSFGEKSHALREALDSAENESPERGILMLATRGSQSVMEVANESRNVLQMRWFSPNLIEYEEWALRGPGDANLKTNATFGIYSVHYVGAQGWDNPSRRKTMRDLQYNIAASPRILASILAYDAAWVARNTLKNELSLPMTGLSGEIAFDPDGYRQEGLYFGVSAVPELVSPLVTLLQSSTWILEDVLNLVETIEGQYLITEYNVATSSMLTQEELSRFSSQTANSSECEEHLMEIMTHDPFNQMPTKYIFRKENLPLHLLIPNQHGYGITFLCEHLDTSRTTLKLACTPGGRFSDPVKCFRSHFSHRNKRAAGNYPSSAYRSYEYSPTNSYYQYPQGQGLSPGTNLYTTYYNELAAQRYPHRRDDGSSPPPLNSYYGPPNQGYAFPSATYGTMTSRFDAVIQSDDASSTTPMSAPPPPGGKLPELRQVLKAAKPFVGSCVGAATGCAVCVLVLGRLPLGTAPPACTGPCFVGVFGSCGALLGRAFSETTVICTELFRQGYLDVDIFLADAEFGRNLYAKSPMTLKGYRILANPLVKKMRKSKEVTELVAKFAIPWAKYMQYSLGYTDEFNWLGYGVHAVGTPLCYLVGYAHSRIFSARNISLYNKFVTPVSTTALLATITLLAFLALHRYYSSKKKSTRSSIN